MIHIKLDFKCPLCGNVKKFYTMPVEEKVASNDYVCSENKFQIKCKECKNNTLLTVTLENL